MPFAGLTWYVSPNGSWRGDGSRERPWSLEKALSHPKFEPLTRRAAEPASQEAITAVHPAEYVRRLDEAVPDSGLVAIDADTALGPATMDAARKASGAVMAAADAVLALAAPSDRPAPDAGRGDAEPHLIDTAGGRR